jgi:dihydroorotate dehydrogenase electron transfer subunit
VQVSTNDGSKGHKGLVTALLEEAIENYGKTIEVFACGPNPMLKAVCHISAAYGIDAEVSLDHAMCCGVGACFACVVKMKADTPEGWEYVRTCMAGPVFKASRTYWD